MISVAGGTALLIATLSACGGGAPSPSRTGAGPTGAGATPTASAGAGQPAATTTDPCQLVTAAEASALTGAAYGPGTERAAGIGKTCVYGSRTKNVFMVDVWQGSVALLHQLRTQVTAEIEQTGSTAQLDPVPVAGLGTEATAYQVSSNVFNAGSIFVLDGGYALYLVDEVTGAPAPTTAALTAAARTAVGRLP